MIFTQQLGITQVIPALGMLDHQRAQLPGQAVPHFGRVAMVLQLLPKAFTHTATIHDFTKQKDSTITAGFSPAQQDGNRGVAGWFLGRYCFTHGERPSLIKFLQEHIDYKG